MYTMIRASGFRRTVTAEGLSLVTSLAIAEAFYKFHSFVLESVAFLLTWFLVGAAVTSARWLFASAASRRAVGWNSREGEGG
jgi:uncharacterized membrane protein YoaK (UPF0700 family)